MKTTDALQLIAWAGGTALLGGVTTLLVLRVLRRVALAHQIAVVAVAPCLTALLGAWVGSQAMFFSDHDRTALTVLLIAAGVVGGVAAILLSRRVAAADAALQAVERDRAVEGSRRELVAWVSHDLRSPLAGIRAMAEALADGVVAEPGDVERYHEQLRLESERLAGLVDDLFELSRTQSGVLVRELERVSLADLVSDAIAGMAPVAAAKNVRLVGRCDDARVELEASAPELLRALRNILDNAIRYTPSDGSVIVQTACAGDRARVTVADDGGGLAARDLDRVFEAGYRGDPARTPGHAGGGFGLAIARGVVEMHHGEISIVNSNGGARVTIELPVVRVGEV